MRSFFVLFFLLAVFYCPAQNLGSVLLINGNVIDVEAGVVSQRTVLIEGDKIKAVGTYQQLLTQASKNTRRVDCTGKYIIPGLCDMHVHLEGADGHIDETEFRLDHFPQLRHPK